MANVTEKQRELLSSLSRKKTGSMKVSDLDRSEKASATRLTKSGAVTVAEDMVTITDAGRQALADAKAASSVPKRGPGRPKKVQAAPAASSSN